MNDESSNQLVKKVTAAFGVSKGNPQILARELINSNVSSDEIFQLVKNTEAIDELTRRKRNPHAANDVRNDFASDRESKESTKRVLLSLAGDMKRQGK